MENKIEICAVTGKSNSGKTAAINRYFGLYIKQSGARVSSFIDGKKSDFISVVVSSFKSIIGFASVGDNIEIIKKNFEMLDNELSKDKDFDLIICAVNDDVKNDFEALTAGKYNVKYKGVSDIDSFISNFK